MKYAHCIKNQPWFLNFFIKPLVLMPTVWKIIELLRVKKIVTWEYIWYGDLEWD